MEYKSLTLKRKEGLNSFSKKVAKIIDPKIKEILGSFVDKKTQKLVNYQIEVGGKRIRPALAILSCLACGGKIEDVLYPAAGLEILHNYTLIVDDIIDKSELRRGKPTAWRKFGKSIAECVNVDYSAAVFQTANRSKNHLEISEIFAEAMKAIADGEILDILFEQSGREDEPYIAENRYFSIADKDYFRMVGKKTATLFQACCEVGGICAQARNKGMESLRNYGFNLGIAFQIKDDTLDIFGEEKKFGKKIGNDIRERKLGNIVVSRSLKELPRQERQKILSILKQKKIKNSDIKKVIKAVKKTNAKENTSKLGERYIKEAKESLKLLPQNKWSSILEEVADFAMGREK